MILGVLLAHKRYPLRKYMFVLLIVFGVSLFLYKDKKPGKHGVPQLSFDFGFGEVLLLLSLMMDGCTGAIQERMRSGCATKSQNMMLNMNLWSTVYLLVSLLISQEIFGFFAFVGRYPSVLVDMISFSIASSLGQYFIFVTVADFGPLPCSIVTTTRKFFTILASVIYFQHPLTTKQWIGTIMVFIGLSLDSFWGKAPAKPK